MRFLLITAVISLLAACSSSPSPLLPPVELEPLQNKLTISRQWIFTVGKGVSDFYLKLNPVIDKDNDKGYAIDYKGHLYAFKLTTGKIIWDIELKIPASTGLLLFNNVLFFGNSKGELTAFDIQSKNTLWRVQLSSEVLSTPVIEKDIIVAKTIDGHLYGLNSDTGTQRWLYQSIVPRLTLRGNSSAVINNGIVINASDNGKLTALTLNSGKVLWETTIAVAQGRNELERVIDLDVDPVVVDDVIYTVGYQGRLAAVKITSGEIIWNRDFSSYSGLYVDAYRVYITDAMGQIWALNRYNGSTLWRQDKLLRRKLTAPQVQENYLIVADYDGYLHWLNRDDGNIIARKQLNSSDIFIEDADDSEPLDKSAELAFSLWNNILVRPIVVDKLILSLDRVGHLEAFQLEKENTL